MRHSRLFQVYLLAVLCLAISGLAEAGKGGHPDQFPYPSYFAQYSDSKTGCGIQAFESGSFDVFFQNGLDSTSISPAFCSFDVLAYLYDPSTMSNSSKKLSSTQTSYIGVSIDCSDYQIPISNMTASADAKKAIVTVKISDASLQDQIYGPVSIRPQGISYEAALTGAGFKLKQGYWINTCKAMRSSGE